jgi:hypothetical protein
VIANGGTTTNAPTGGTTLHLCVRDQANNVGTNSGPFNVDKTAPELEITGDDANVWYNVERTATITRSDAGGSAIFQTRYSVGTNNLGADCSGGTLLATDSNTHLVTVTGGTTLYVCVKDNAGNVTTASGVFNIDKTAPTCPAFNSTNWSPYPVQWQQAGNTTVFYMQGATDAGGSGIDVSSGTCTTGNTNNSTCAGGSGKIVINDNAGNTTACDSPANKIDSNAPTTPTLTSAPNNALGASYTNNDSVNVFISGSQDNVGGTDVNSGLLPLPYTYVLTGAEVSGSEATYSAAVVINDEGVTTVTAYAYDYVLNRSQAATNTVKIDRTKPIIDVDLAGGQSVVATSSASGTGLLYQESPTINLSATDPVNSSNGSVGSGFAGMAYIWLEDTDPIESDMLTACGSALDTNNGAFPGWESNEFTTQIPGNGTHTLCAVAKDNAGNLSDIQALSYTLDTDAPSILLTINQPAPSMISGWYLSMPTFTAEAIDNNGSGVKSMQYLLIPTSEASTSAKYDENYDIIADTDSRIVTITPTSTEMMDFSRLIGAPPIVEGNYTLFVGAEDNTTGIPHSPTLREKVSVDLQKPISDLSYVETATGVVTPLTSDNPNYALLQAEPGIDSILTTDSVTVNTTNFDPLSSDLTQAPSDSYMTSGLKSCVLQYRSVALRQDGSGLLETTGDGAINWSSWTTDADYLTSDCAATKAFVPAHNTAYQLRLQATDNADHVADLETSNVLIINLDPVYRPDFANMDDNVAVDQIQNHILYVDCRAASGCGNITTLNATLDEDLAVNTYEVCLTINDTNIEKCQTVTSSTTAKTHFSFSIAASEFPKTQDVFIGGKLKTTWTGGDALNNMARMAMATELDSPMPTHNNPVLAFIGRVLTALSSSLVPTVYADENPSFTVDYNVIIFVKRDYPPIVKATRQNSYIFMRNGKLN